MDNQRLGTHEGCGGTVVSAEFKSGVDQYCTKCGNFGVDRTPLASPFQTVNLIAVSYQGEFTCSANCLVKNLSDGVECRDAIARAQKLSPIEMIDEVLVVMNNEVVYQHINKSRNSKEFKINDWFWYVVFYFDKYYEKNHHTHITNDAIC